MKRYLGFIPAILAIAGIAVASGITYSPPSGSSGAADTCSGQSCFIDAGTFIVKNSVGTVNLNDTAGVSLTGSGDYVTIADSARYAWNGGAYIDSSTTVMRMVLAGSSQFECSSATGYCTQKSLGFNAPQYIQTGTSVNTFTGHSDFTGVNAGGYGIGLNTGTNGICMNGSGAAGCSLGISTVSGTGLMQVIAPNFQVTGSITSASTATRGISTLSGGGTATVTVLAGAVCTCTYSTVGIIILLCNVASTTLTITGTAGAAVSYHCI